MNSKLKLLLSETENGCTLPAKIYPTVCVCHSVVLALAMSPTPPLLSPLALLRWVCCRAMDDKDNLLSCLSPRVQLDWQFRLQRTPGLAQISLFRLPTLSSPRFLGNCQTVTISKVLSELLSRNLPKRSCICCDGGDKDRAEFFEIIAMMCPGLKLVLKSKAALLDLFKWGMWSIASISRIIIATGSNADWEFIHLLFASTNAYIRWTWVKTIGLRFNSKLLCI